MDWTSRQGHILSGGGTSAPLFVPPKFPFQEDECPHFHKGQGTIHTNEVFKRWASEGQGRDELLVGAWHRPLFVGGWDHSDAHSERGERAFNLQTATIFIDIRLPRATADAFAAHHSLATMTDHELRLFARRHAFAGYTRTCHELMPGAATSHPPSSSAATSRAAAEREGQSTDFLVVPVGVRHHNVDWNYVGIGRPRPNKWRVEMRDDGLKWKEWGWAQDRFGQHVYMETWERLDGDGGGRGAEGNGDKPLPALALQLRTHHADEAAAYLVVVGDHFNYIRDRPRPSSMPAGWPSDSGGGSCELPTSLVERVDVLLSETPPPGAEAEADGPWKDADTRRARRAEAESLLSLVAVHGRVAPGAAVLSSPAWGIDRAIHPWMEGHALTGIAMAEARAVNGGHTEVVWGGKVWDVLENTFGDVQELNELFRRGCNRALPMRARL